ncbi:hypothetical protein LINPERPRIM_LOCUS22620 [Linum perenne]
METSHPNSSVSLSTTNWMPIPNPTCNSILASAPVWPTIDDPLGLTEEESLTYAHFFYSFGFSYTHQLWLLAMNCFYF